MPSFSPRLPSSGQGALAKHSRTPSWQPRHQFGAQSSPPPVPPRTYAPLPKELQADIHGMWFSPASPSGHEPTSASPVRLLLDLNQSGLRQRRLATRAPQRLSLPSPRHSEQPTRRYIYRQPTLVLKPKARRAVRPVMCSP